MVDCNKSFSVDGVRVASQLVDFLFKVITLFSSAGVASKLLSHIERATNCFFGVAFQLSEADSLIRLSDHHLLLLATLHLLNSVRWEQFRVSLKEFSENSASMLHKYRLHLRKRGQTLRLGEQLEAELHPLHAIEISAFGLFTRAQSLLLSMRALQHSTQDEYRLNNHWFECLAHILFSLNG